MGKKKKLGKIMTYSEARRRGWTKTLMLALLPAPEKLYLGGRSVHAWEWHVVRNAEDDPLFQAAKAERQAAKTGAQPSAPTQAPIPQRAPWSDALQTAWDAAERPEGRVGVLAAWYHQAIVHQGPPSQRIMALRAGQATSYLSAFLALEKDPAPADRESVLSRFVRARCWMDRNRNAPLFQEVVRRYPSILLRVAAAELDSFTTTQPEADVDGMLAAPDFPFSELLQHRLSYLYSVLYVPRAIRTSLNVLIALNPKDEYPEARAMARRFVLHLGGTNTGKTYAGLQQLKWARTGVYLGPLRLLALEAQEALLDADVACSLTTGEEEDIRPGDTHVAATAEKLDLKARYDVAVIDECQMIADPQRGYAWTRAILGVLAPEIHLCAAPEAEGLLVRLIESCGDSYTVERHERKVPLIPMRHPVSFSQVQPGDALITFSKVGVLRIAEDLRQAGKEPAIIYGALPYATRRKQMEGFLSGQMQYVVATDAIGMGLNLPIRRIIFTATSKFDGVETRELKPAEIRQIAGRAGRYGMYDRGYVGATHDLHVIQAGLDAPIPPLTVAVQGFSDLVLSVDYDLLEVLTEWSKMPSVEPYRKLDISRYLTIISKLREMGFVLTKEEELRAANIPFDETEPPLQELFVAFLRLWQAGEELPQPVLPQEGKLTLPVLELFCRKLDLYYSFCKAFSCPVDLEELYDQREEAAELINEILLYHLKNNIRFCAHCGAPLPLHQSGRLCEACYRDLMKKRRH